MDSDLLTKEQLADKLQIGVRTIDRFIKEGIPHIKIGRQVRFQYQDVLEWFKNREEK